MSNDEGNKAIIQWLGGDLSDEDVQQALPQEDLLAYRQILDEVDSWTPDNDQQIFDIKEITRATPQDTTKVRKLNRWMPMSIAASVLLLIVAGIYLLNGAGTTEYAADAGESMEINLPDGMSTVTLAAGSAIQWDDEEWSETGRKMEVTGKAYFKVGEGSPFVVKTTNGTVEVLGTEFEISGFEETLIVACYEGKVCATAADQQQVTLTAGEESVYHKDAWAPKRDAKGALPPWFAEELEFKDTSLEEVFAQLEKTYSVKIIAANEVDLTQKYTGDVPTKNLKTSMKLVLTSFNIKYKTIGKTLYLFK